MRFLVSHRMSSQSIARVLRRIFVIIISFYAATAHAQQSVSALYEDARQRYYGGDSAAAIIQLKNALKEDDQHVPSLVLMGDILLAEHQPAAAEQIYSEALLLGAGRDDIVPKLASAFMMQGKYLELLEELPADSVRGRTKAELLGYYALAYLSLNDAKAAADSIAAADEIDPDALNSNIARVNLQLSNNSLEDALNTARRLTGIWPDASESWTRLGIVLQAQGKNTAALEAYSNALLLSPEDGNARLSRAALLVDINRESEAAVDLEIYGKTYPLDPRSIYLQAQILSRSGDSTAATEALEKVASIFSVLPPEVVLADEQLTMIAAMANYRLGNFETAKTYLQAYQALDATNIQAILLLASTWLELGEAKRAVNLLKPIYIMEKDNPEVVAMMTTAYTEAGLYDNAIQLLLGLGDRITADSNEYIQLALTRLSAGQTTAGLTALEQVYADDHSRSGVAYYLAMTYLEMGREEDATRIAEELVQREQDSTAFFNLLGMARLGSGDVEGAKRAFLKAADLTPGFVPAKIGLSRAERYLGDYNAAQKTLDGVLEDNPKNVYAMMEMARLQLSRQDARGAMNWAEEAVRADTEAKSPRILLIEVLAGTDQLDSAEEVARDATQLFENDLDCLATLARVQALAGKRSDSLNTYRRMQKTAGGNIDQLYRIGTLQMRLRGWEDARYTLYTALNVQPDHIPSLLAYLRVHLALAQLDEALKISDKILELDPGSAEARGLHARTLLARQQYKLADASFQEALAITYDPRWVVGRYQSLIARNLTEEAETVLRQEATQHPEDIRLRGALIDHLLGEQRWGDAKGELETILKQKPGHPFHLNNLAYTLNELGDPRALDFARQAHDLKPDNASINDTLGWVLVNQGAPAEGLSYLREARSRAGQDPQISYHLAVALHKLGRDSEALKELQQAMSEGADFPERHAARHLVRTLKSAD
jgi:putative PEP-CTERM system TPR-repeat lipoprotein